MLFGIFDEKSRRLPHEEAIHDAIFIDGLALSKLPLTNPYQPTADLGRLN